MSKRIPLLVGVAVVLIAVVSVYIGIQSPRPPAPTAPPTTGTPAAGPTKPPLTVPEEAKAPPAGVKVEGAEIEQRDPTGAVQWKVHAGGEFEFDKDQQEVIGHDVRFEMLQSDKLPVIVKAPIFEANYDTRKLVFREGVSGHLSDGSAHFQVNHLTYDFDTMKLVGSGGAKFVQGRNVATAREIILDAKRKKVRMRGGVTFVHRESS